MKPINTSFLFFCLLLIVFMIKGEAQIKTDSLRHYVKFIKESKNNSDLTEAIIYLKEANILHKQNKNTLGLVYNLIYVARAQRKMGFLYEGESSAVEALELLDQMHGDNKAYRISLYNFFGILYYEFEDYENSIKYYNKSLDINEDKEKRATIINNIGNVYFKQKEYKSAVNFYKKAYDISLNFTNKKNTARALDNLGFAKSKVDNTDALENLEEALEIRKQLNYQPGIITSYLHLGEYYKDRKDIKKAIEYAIRAIKVADLTDNIDFKNEALSFYTKLSDDPEILRFIQIYESIKSRNLLVKKKYSKTKYDFDKIDAELREVELLREKEKSNKILFQSIGFLIFASSIFLYFLLKSKHKKEKIREVYLKETQLSKKVHDELANDMSDLMNYVEIEIDVSNEKKAPLLNHLEDVYLRTRDISTETASIDLVNFTESLRYLLLQHNRQGTKVIVNDINNIDWIKVQDHVKMVVYRCLQELMVNMKKHSKATVVSVVFKTHGAENEIRYVDDGIGTSMSTINTNGLQNVEYRIKSIGGTFSFDTSEGHGFKATLKFKN